MKKNNVISLSIVLTLSIANSSVSYCRAEQAVSSIHSVPLTTYNEPESSAVLISPIKKGDSYILRLDANHTTGYSWVSTCPATDIVDIQQRYEKKDSARGMTGTGGYDVFTLTGKKAGKTSCTFEYKRPWENDVPAARQETVSIEVIE